MKTAVITYCLGYNYGAMLQSYATIKALESIGHEVQLINFHHPWSFGLDSRDWRNYVGRSPRILMSKIKTMWKQRTLRKKFSPMWAMWPLTEYYGCDGARIIANPPECDCLISGSDQTWNTSAPRELFAPYFLNFGSDSIRRISYAPSLGNIKFREEDTEWIVERLKRYSAISVREKDDVDYLASLGIMDVVQMPDPTMIVPRNVYDELISGEEHRKYSAVIYMLGPKNKANESLLTKILDNNGICLKDTLNVELQSFHCKGAKNKVTTVAEWVDAIANAEIVITNSFHAVVFSLIYEKPFVFVKFNGNKVKSNNRIENLLNGTSEEWRMTDLSANLDLSPYYKKPEFKHKIDEFCKIGTDYLRKNIKP